MIDNFALLLTHVLIAIALIRLLGRADLDNEDLLEVEEEKVEREGPSLREKRRARARAEARDA
ncbi:hypothetical protein GRI42_10650 [Erythrobacter gaetbuli]|uniref:Uncharacterized protein n=1 Tax=Qipengyuania gaetbuli TaxID=266952 RepID=A0A844Y145_9SPHN|nr:hypothetical protein [Qipengyuania gaetbuli]MXO51761.1 hypothetical protein [Qipengyuania gaetbuli]